MSSSRRIFQPGGVLGSSNGGNSYPNVSTYHSTSPGHSTMGSRSPHTSSTTTNHSSPHGTTSHGGTISLRRSHPAPANGPHDGKEIRPFGITNSSRTALRYGFNAAVRGTHVQTSSSGSSSSPSHASRNTIGTGTRRPIGSYFMTSPLQSLIAPQIGYGPTNITSASSSSKASVNTGSNAHYRSPHARSAGRHGAGVSWLSNQRATGSASTPGATPTVSSPMSGSGAVEIHTPPGLSTTVTGRHQVPLIYGRPQTSSSKEGIHSNSTSNNNNNKALRYQTKVLTNNYVVTSKNSSSSPQGSDRDASALIIEGASAENKASFFSSISMKETNSGLNNSTAPPKPTEFFLDLDSIDARLNIVKKGRLSGRSGSSGSPTNTQRGSSVGTDNVTGSSIGGAVVEGSIGPATLSRSGSPVPQIPAICSHETSATPLSLIEDHGPLQATTGAINSFSTDRSLSSLALELSVFGLSQSVEDQTVHSPSVNYSVVASCGLPSEETIEHSFEQNEVKTENTEESREVSFTVPNAPPEKKVKATPSRTHRRSTNTTKNIDDRAHTGIDVTVHYQRNNANDSEKIINTISPSKQLVEVSQPIDMYSESTQHSSLQTFVLAPESVDEEEPLAQMNDKEPCSVLNSLVHHLFNHYFKSPVLSMLTQTPTPSPQKELLKVESNTVQNDIVDVPEQEATVSSPYGFHIPIPLLDDNESLRTPPRTRKCSYPDP